MAKRVDQSKKHAIRIGIYQIRILVLRHQGINYYSAIKKVEAINLFCEYYGLERPDTKRAFDGWIVCKYRDKNFKLIGSNVPIKPKGKKGAKKSKKKTKTLRQKKYHKYLLSDEWAQIKIDLFEVRGRKCERCGSKSNIQVHHLTYKNIFNEEPEDLEVVCRKCHKLEHGIK